MKEDVRVRNLAKPTLADVHKIFGTWFGDDYDLDVIDVVLAIAATAKFDGDPAWLQIVGGSGEAKTETVTAPPLHSWLNSMSAPSFPNHKLVRHSYERG